MKDLPFWLPKKNTLIWYLLFIGLFLFSLDFWNWGSSTPLLLGLPFWMWYLFGLTLVLSGAYYAFSRFFWREDE
ncbi:MAG: hypothetical protein WC525_00985 [Candidatus Thermoplasmatota archaeon]